MRIDIDFKHLILIVVVARFLDSFSIYLSATNLIEERESIEEIASMENNPILSFLWTQTGNLSIGLILDFMIIVGSAILLLKLLTSFIPGSIVFFST